MEIETQTPENSENNSEESKPLTIADLDKLLDKKLNAAISSHMKRIKTPVAAQPPVKEAEQSTDSNDSNVILKRALAKIEALENESKKAKEEAYEIKLFSKIEKTLQGKVVENFSDFAAKEFRKYIQTDENGEMSVVIDNQEYLDLETAVEGFLKKEKRFKASTVNPAVAIKQTKLSVNNSGKPQSLAEMFKISLETQ